MASLSHSQSLRLIGESLEVLGISAFDVEKDGENYLVSVTPNKRSRERGFVKKILQTLRRPRGSNKTPPEPHLLRYTPADISRLADEQRSKHGESNIMPDAHRLAQVLRLIGHYLDRKEVRTFSISLSSHLLAVRYETISGNQKHESFTVKNLYDLAVHMYLQRSKRFGWVA
jgi:hypothetical protein